MHYMDFHDGDTIVVTRKSTDGSEALGLVPGQVCVIRDATVFAAEAQAVGCSDATFEKIWPTDPTRGDVVICTGSHENRRMGESYLCMGVEVVNGLEWFVCKSESGEGHRFLSHEIVVTSPGPMLHVRTLSGNTATLSCIDENQDKGVEPRKRVSMAGKDIAEKMDVVINRFSEDPKASLSFLKDLRNEISDYIDLVESVTASSDDITADDIEFAFDEGFEEGFEESRRLLAAYLAEMEAKITKPT